MIRFWSADVWLECSAGCGETSNFTLDDFDYSHAAADVELAAYEKAGWDSWGNCPVCARERAQSEAADSAMRDRKAGIEG